MDLNLRYFRFKTDDLEESCDFWVGVIRMQKDNQLNVGSKVRCCVGYPGDSVGLRFEYDSLGSLSKNVPLRSAKQSIQSRLDKLPKSPSSDISIVLHVHSVADVVERCRNMGFIVWIDVNVISADVKCAVLLDPSAIKVRVMESKYFHINPQKTAGHMAYLSVPIKHADTIPKALKFYETMQYKHILGTSSSAIRLGTFRLVDQEQFVQGLTSYHWLSNGDRDKYTSLCLINSKTALTAEQAETSISSKAKLRGGGTHDSHNKLFLGVALFVADLQELVKHYGDVKNKPTGHTFHMQEIPGFPRFIYFFDPAFIPVEITDDVVSWHP